MFVDGLEINNWSRSTIKEVKSGGIDVVHATCGVWEDLAGAITKIGDWRHFARENSDLVRLSSASFNPPERFPRVSRFILRQTLNSTGRF